MLHKPISDFGNHANRKTNKNVYSWMKQTKKTKLKELLELKWKQKIDSNTKSNIRINLPRVRAILMWEKTVNYCYLPQESKCSHSTLISILVVIGNRCFLQLSLSFSIISTNCDCYIRLLYYKGKLSNCKKSSKACSILKEQNGKSKIIVAHKYFDSYPFYKL